MEPHDKEKLKEKINGLKKELHEVKEENKILKAKNEQYKKRANYAKTKFFDIKNKEGVIVNEAQQNMDSQYRLKNTEMKQHLKKMQDDKDKVTGELNQTKIKLSQTQANTKFRDEYEKSLAKMKKLCKRINELEAEKEQREQYNEIQQQIEESMMREDQLIQ